MFKKIPGNTKYRINLKEEIIDCHGKLYDGKRDRRGRIEMEIFGDLRKVTPKWLAFLAWYESGSIEDLKNQLNNIRFYPADKSLKVRCGCVMQFTDPIYYCDGFRYIPSYPRYAIDINSVIIDTFKNESVSVDYEQNGYLHAYIYSPDHGANRYIRTHRLLALAWLPNKDFLNKPIINHINGKRCDNTLTNLEWCSHSENAQHALNTGLNPCSVMMKTRDIFTGEVEIHKSVAELARKLGFSRGYSSSSFTDRLPGFLYKKRYEIKQFDDSSPWYYENNAYNPDEPKKQHFSIRVFDKKTGETKTYTNVRKFYKVYGVWGALNLEDGISRFKEKYKDYEISYKRNVITGPYQLLNLENKTVKVVRSIKEAAEYIGHNKNELNSDLRRDRKYIYSKKWIVAPGTNEINQTEYQEKPKPSYKVLIVNDLSDEKIVAKSINEAYQITGIMPRTIQKRLKDGKVARCFYFRPSES